MVTHTRRNDSNKGKGSKPDAKAPDKGNDTKHDEAVQAARDAALNALEAAGLGPDKTEWTPAELTQRDEILAAHGVSEDPGILDTLGIPESAAQSTGGTEQGKRGKRIPNGTSIAGALRIYMEDDEKLFAVSRLNNDDEANETAFNVLGGRLKGLAKKVGEKALNLLRNQGSRDAVQVYTRIALDLLIQKGEFTSKDLMKAYATAGDGYSPGTQAAQSNQIMQLFPALLIADRDGSKLTLRDESVIVASFKKSTGTKANAIGAAAANRAARDEADARAKEDGKGNESRGRKDTASEPAAAAA